MANINVDVNIQLSKEERETLIKAHNILQEVVENLGEAGQDNADEFFNAMYGAEHIGYLLNEIGLEENEINKKEVDVELVKVGSPICSSLDLTRFKH